MVITVFIASYYYIFEFVRNGEPSFGFTRKGTQKCTPHPTGGSEVNLGDVFGGGGQELAKSGFSSSRGLGPESLGTLDGTKSPWGPRMCSQRGAPSFEELPWVLAGRVVGFGGRFRSWDELIVFGPIGTNARRNARLGRIASRGRSFRKTQQARLPLNVLLGRERT